MIDIDPALLAHLRSGATTLCRCWRVTRADGRVFGFTDHDLPLTFGGSEFRPDDGLSARQLEQTTGLSVDNSEAMGVLSADGVTEDDILAGRFDGARVENWLVNWRNTDERALLFRGEIGEITRAGGAFRAELRGLTEALNRPQGRVYQSPCPAILGDSTCRVDTDAPQFSVTLPIQSVDDGDTLDLGPLADFAPRWFERGMLEVKSGSSWGDRRVVKRDEGTGADRRIVLWDSLRGDVRPGDRVRLVAGCDKRFETCVQKFDNVVNFQGFPHMPGEDFLMAYPVRGQEDSGDDGGGRPTGPVVGEGDGGETDGPPLPPRDL